MNFVVLDVEELVSTVQTLRANKAVITKVASQMKDVPEINFWLGMLDVTNDSLMVLVTAAERSGFDIDDLVALGCRESVVPVLEHKTDPQFGN